MKSHLEELFRVRHRIGKTVDKIITKHNGVISFEILWYKFQQHTFAKVISKQLFLIFLNDNVKEGKLIYDSKSKIYSFPKDSDRNIIFSGKSNYKDLLRFISDFGKIQGRLHELYQLEIEKREAYFDEIVQLKQDESKLLTSLAEFLHDNKINHKSIVDLLPLEAQQTLNSKLDFITSKPD